MPKPVRECRFVANLQEDDLPAFRNAVVDLAGGFTEMGTGQGTRYICSRTSSWRASVKVFLGRAVKSYEAGEAYPNFVNRVNAPGSAALGGGRWVTEKVARSPLYRVCQDLADRLGIAQGFLAVGKNSSTGRAGFAGAATAPDIVSCEDAAQRIGVTAEAIRKAIREKRLPARQVGRTYLVERKAVDAYAARSGREVNIASGANGQGALGTVAKVAKRRRMAHGTR